MQGVRIETKAAKAVIGGRVARNEQYVVGLDVGSSKVTVIVGEAMEDGSLEIVGTGLADAKGIRRGVIVNLEQAVDSIKRALDDAELMAGVDIDSVYLGLSGGHARALNSRGVVAVSGVHREITREDVRRAIDAAKAPPVPNGYEILHVLPQDFVVDEQEQIIAPVGMTGSRLEVQTHIVTCRQSTSENVVASVNRAGVRVIDTVLEQLAAAEAVLTADEKELGVAIVDVGHGVTDYAVYERGSLWHTGAVMQGGELFTKDLAVGLRTPIADAERTKRRDGCALSTLVDEEQLIDVASVGNRQPRRVKRRLVAEILQPRAEEIFHLLSDDIRKKGFEQSLNAGLVLTGGGSALEGMIEIAEQIFDLPVRRGSPLGVRGLTDHIDNPAFSTAVGLVMYAHRIHVIDKEQTPVRVLDRVWTMLRSFLS